MNCLEKLLTYLINNHKTNIFGNTNKKTSNKSKNFDYIKV